jgi:hypothetical protein
MTLQVHPRTRMALKELSKDSQDHPGAVRVHPTTREKPHRIIQRTRDDPPGSSKNCQGLSNNQVGTTMDASGYVQINIHGWWINLCGYG